MTSKYADKSLFSTNSKIMAIFNSLKHNHLDSKPLLHISSPELVQEGEAQFLTSCNSPFYTPEKKSALEDMGMRTMQYFNTATGRELPKIIFLYDNASTKECLDPTQHCNWS